MKEKLKQIIKKCGQEIEKNTDFFHSIVVRDYGGRDYRCNSF